MTSLICDIKYPQRTTPVSIQDEEHVIKTSVPYSISLKENPSEDYTVAISGYTESTSIPTSETEFYVDYDLSVIYFHLNKAGEDVSVSYYGLGSPIISEDVKRFSSLFTALKNSLFSFRLEAFSCSKVRLYGGKIVSGATVYTQKELCLDFGVNGNYPITLSEGCFKKILVGGDTTLSEIAIVEGPEAPRYDAAHIPTSYATDFHPVGIVAISSDFNILQEDIIPIRNFLL